MSFNRNSRLDPSQVEDRRGRRGTGTVVAVGGGAIGLIITIVIMLLGGNVGSITGDGGQGLPATDYPGGINDLEAQCQTGADANTREDCRIVGFVNSIQSYWSDEFAQQWKPVHTSRYRSFHGVHGGRLWNCQQRHGAVLLSGRPEGLSGPRLLQ